MNLVPKRRLQNGGILSFATALLFILFLIGAAFFYLGKLVGGHKELTNAADAGVLSVARQAPVICAVELNDLTLPGNNASTPLYPYADFTFLSDEASNTPPNYEIDLTTYNRAAAQAMLVAMNATAEGTPAAAAQAKLTIQAVQEIGKRLKTNFTTSNTPNNVFSQLAGENTLSMLGQPQVILNENIQSGYIDRGYAANVFIDPTVATNLDSADQATSPTASQSIAALASTNFYSNVNGGPQPEKTAINALYGNDINGNSMAPISKLSFIAGYQKYTFFKGTANEVDLVFVPNLPTIAAHRIDQPRFITQTANISSSSELGAVDFANTPPNCFEAYCKAMDVKSKKTLDVISCAVIGVIDSSLTGGGPLGMGPTFNYSYYPYNPTTSNNVQFNYFPATIPAGFVRIVNAPQPNNAMTNPSGDFNTNILNDTDPAMTGAQRNALSSSVASPVVAYDASKNIFNSIDAVSPSSNNSLEIWVAKGNFTRAAVQSGDIAANAALYAPFGVGASGLATLQFWAKQNTADPNTATQVSASLHMGKGLNEMASATALNAISGYYSQPMNDAAFNTGEPAWMDTMLPIVESNLGYTPGAVPSINPNTINSTKSTFTAVEWLKAKLLQAFAADYVSYPPAVVPPTNIASGLRWYQPWDNQGNLVHYPWPQPTAVMSQNPPLLFEQPGTMFQYISNIIQRNQIQTPGSPPALNLNDPFFVQFMNPIVAAVKQINPKYTLYDVLVAFGWNNPSAPKLDLGDVYYLHSDPTGQFLVLDQNPPVPLLPDGKPAYNPATLVASGNPVPVIPAGTALAGGTVSSPALPGYFCYYTVSGSTPFNPSLGPAGLVGDDRIKTIVDTAGFSAADTGYPFSNLDYITTLPDPATTLNGLTNPGDWRLGDGMVHRCPWKQLCPNEATNPKPFNIIASDEMTFIPSTGYHNFLGEIRMANWIAPAYPSIPN